MSAISIPRASFIAHYDDPQAGIVREYTLSFYRDDNSVEMFDNKSRRCFLKRVPMPALSPAEFFVRNNVTVNSRLLRLVDFADVVTRRAFSDAADTTLLILKPEAYDAIGHVLQLLHNSGLSVVHANLVRLEEPEALRFLEPHRGSLGGDFSGAVQQMTSYPSVLFELGGDHAVERTVALVGPSTTRVADGDAPGTFRSLFADSGPPPALCSIDRTAAAADVAYARERGLLSWRSNASLSGCSLVVVKPHAMVAGDAGRIVQHLMDAGVEISALAVRRMSPRDAADFLEVYKGVLPEFEAHVRVFSSGPLLALECRAEDAVTTVRALCGPHDVDVAKVLRPDTIRAKFGIDRVRNAVHCTDLPEDGPSDSEFFFRLLNMKPQS